MRVRLPLQKRYKEKVAYCMKVWGGLSVGRGAGTESNPMRPSSGTDDANRPLFRRRLKRSVETVALQSSCRHCHLVSVPGVTRLHSSSWVHRQVAGAAARRDAEGDSTH